MAFIASVSIIFSDSFEDMITGGGGQLSVATIQSLSGTLTSAIVNEVSTAGYAGVFGLMLLEGTSLPVPSEVILPFAGYLVSIGRLEFWLTVLVATVAGLIGALIDYSIGNYLGMHVIRNYGSRFFIGPEQMRKIESLFERHGGIIIFASRLIPGVRTLASFPAGSAKMSLPKFTLYTAIGCFVFNAFLVYVGDYLGSHWDAIRAIGTLEFAATALAIVVAIWVFFRLQRRQRSQTNAD